MNLYVQLREMIVAAIEDLGRCGDLPTGLDTSRISVDAPRDPEHGDVATNAAMVLAKPVGRKPRDIAAMLATVLAREDNIDSAEIAGPGFINIRFSRKFWYARLGEVLRAGVDYGKSDIGAGKKVNVEYVSANPTGPMHIGHARGAVVGDALAGVLEKAGYDVCREYYINDAGAQVDTLARSLHLRYLEALGDTIDDFPEGLYPGDYLIGPASDMAARDGDKWRDAPESDWLETFRLFAIDAMMAMIRDDLARLGVRHAVFTSERQLVEKGAVDAVLSDLAERGLIYEGILAPPKGKTPDDWEAHEQTLFKASQFGDDTDRPVKKSDGSWTYFATDMAYHWDKFDRGFDTMIDVWGADHGGYVKRMQAAVVALTEDRGSLDVKLCQMVHLTKDGQPVKMSKRSGTFVTLREVVDNVGKDVVRFMMLTRKNDAQLEFDLARVLEQSRDNPVFYVHYAHARACSVLRHAGDVFTPEQLTPEKLAGANLARLTDSAEIDLIRQMAAWPRCVEAAATAHEPHRVAYYLQELAAQFHALWNKGNENANLRFILPDDPEVTLSRLALVQGLALVIASGLKVFDITPVEELR